MPMGRIERGERTDTNDNGGGKVREYRCPARHRIIPYTSIRKSLSSAGKRADLGHVRPHQFRHTYATRLMDQGVPMEHIMALGGWKSSAMAKRYARVNPIHLQKHADRLEELPGHTPDDS